MSNIRTIIGCLLLSAPAVNAAAAIVNEYNAGGATVPGDWFEIVVVGDGNAESTVDMRGWSFRINNDGVAGVGFFTLNNDSYWSTVQAGTILTFHEEEGFGSGGANSSILGVDNFATEGWGWTNIWTDDPAYVDTGSANHDPSFPIDNNDTQISIYDSFLRLVFGPCGENHVGYPGGGVGSDEIFKLEADPSPAITLTSPYNDGSTSTFGMPNVWSGGDFSQSFAAYVVPEPGSWAILAIGAALAIRRVRRG